MKSASDEPACAGAAPNVHSSSFLPLSTLMVTWFLAVNVNTEQKNRLSEGYIAVVVNCDGACGSGKTC